MDMLPGAGEAIKAASHEGWVASLVVFAFVVAYGGLAFLVRTWLKQSETRELRMATRIDALEDYQRTTLHNLILQNTQAVSTLTSALNSRPCMVEDDVIRETLRKRHKGGAI